MRSGFLWEEEGGRRLKLTEEDEMREGRWKEQSRLLGGQDG